MLKACDACADIYNTIQYNIRHGPVTCIAHCTDSEDFSLPNLFQNTGNPTIVSVVQINNIIAHVDN